jgi:hypothetical protein
LGYLKRGNACALNIPMHEQYPFGSLDQNNLAHVGKTMHYPFNSLELWCLIIEYPNDGIGFFV